MGFFSKLKEGLSKTKNSFNEKMNNVFSNFRKVDEELLEELEEMLIMSDVGVETSLKIIDNLRTRIKREKIEDEEGVKKALREEIKKIFDDVQENNEKKIDFGKPKFLQNDEEQKITPAQRGTLVHLCMQKLNFKEEYNVTSPQDHPTVVYDEYIKEGMPMPSPYSDK